MFKPLQSVNVNLEGLEVNGHDKREGTASAVPFKRPRTPGL